MLQFLSKCVLSLFPRDELTILSIGLGGDVEYATAITCTTVDQDIWRYMASIGRSQSVYKNIKTIFSCTNYELVIKP